jgi:hypothetical protein
MEIIIFIAVVAFFLLPEILHSIGDSCRDCLRIDITTDHREHRD